MLVTLQRGMDQRFGLDRGERDYLRKVYGEVFAMVKDLLGHASEDVTRTIYPQMMLAQEINGGRVVIGHPRTVLRSLADEIESGSRDGWFEDPCP